MPATPSRLSRRSPLLKTLGFLAVASGVLVLFGWCFNLQVLKGVLPGYATMKPVTATGFIFSGLVLRLLAPNFGIRPVRSRASLWGRTLAILIMLLGVESFLEIALGFDAGHMSPLSAINFLCLGLAFLWIEVDWPGGHRPSEYLALFVAVTGFLGLAGYIYGVGGLHRSVPFSSTALHTTILFIFVSIGVMLLRPDRGLISVLTSDHVGGWMARRILPITSSLPFVIGWVRTHGERAGLYGHELGFAIFAVINIAIMAIIVWINAFYLNRIDAEKDENEKKIQLASQNLNHTNQELQAEITRREAAQESLRLANDNLENKVAERTAKLLAANKELEAFSYSVSHDLRAPLRAIDGFSKLLLESSAQVLNEEQRSFLQRVCSNSERMGRLIDDMLSFSRLARSELRHSEVNLSELAEQVVEELRKEHPERKVEVSILPGMRTQGDGNLLRVVLVNLLGNAWKFTSKKEEAKIEFSQLEDRGKGIFFIRDNGAGFDMIYAGRLFGAFQRLHGISEFEGNGIGLATVHRILTRHQGTIRAEAKTGEGAAFYFEIPRKSGDLSDEDSPK